MLMSMARQKPPPELRELARRVAAIVRDEVGREAQVFWFGSWVWGDATPRSDLDIGVLGTAALAPASRARIDDELDALPSLRRIDVVDMRCVRQELRDRVLREGVAL